MMKDVIVDEFSRTAERTTPRLIVFAFLLAIPCFVVIAILAKQVYERAVDARLAKSDICAHGALEYGDGKWDLSVNAVPHAAMLSRNAGMRADFTPLTDESLRDLLRLNKVSSLDLRGRPISDGAIKHLKELRRLEVVDLRDTRVTERGVARLREELPTCRIIYELRSGVSATGVER